MKIKSIEELIETASKYKWYRELVLKDFTNKCGKKW